MMKSTATGRIATLVPSNTLGCTVRLVMRCMLSGLIQQKGTKTNLTCATTVWESGEHQEGGLSLLALLAGLESSKHADLVADAGGVQLAIAAMRTHALQEIVQEAALRLLRSISLGSKPDPRATLQGASARQTAVTPAPWRQP